mgnify:CR=1 FL=1
MTPEEQEQFKANIQKKLDKLDRKIADLEELCKPVSPDEAIGRVSRMDAINNRAVNEQALNNNKTKRERLRQALEKVSDPYFGYCNKCGQSIGVGRLSAMPESTLCVNCANK